MNKYLKRILIGFLLSFFALSYYQTARADVISPEYLDAKCRNDEVLVECDTGQRTYPLQKSALQKLFEIDQCKEFTNNPQARFMAANKGFAKYCYSEVSFAGISIYHLRNLVTLILATIIFELAIFYLFGFKSKKSWLAVILVNILSVSIFYIVNIFFLPSSQITIIIGELIIVSFEAILLRIILPELSFSRIFISTLIANLTSATAGSLILLLVKSYFKA